MPTAEEIARSLRGAWRLCLGEERGLDLLDPGMDAFWRSFFAIVLAAPVYGLFLMADRALRETDSAAGAFYLISGIIYVADWLAFPVLMIFIARMLGLSRRYSLYIGAYNWSMPIVLLAICPPFILLGMGLVGEGVAMLLFMAALIFALRAQYMVARLTLGIARPVAAALVAAQYLISMIFGQITLALT